LPVEGLGGPVVPELPVLIGLGDQVAESLMTLCDREISAAGSTGRVYAESLVTSLLIHPYRHHATSGHRLHPPHGGLAASQLRRVKDLIESRLDEDLSLADLAAVAGLSIHHFAQAFRVSTRMPPHRYIILRRIDRAMEALLTSRRPIAEIAVPFHPSAFGLWQRVCIWKSSNPILSIS
jgi:AraC family transcriptional regulator